MRVKFERQGEVTAKSLFGVLLIIVGGDGDGLGFAVEGVGEAYYVGNGEVAEDP
jgi:hypothetical protein